MASVIPTNKAVLSELNSDVYRLLIESLGKQIGLLIIYAINLEGRFEAITIKLNHNILSFTIPSGPKFFSLFCMILLGAILILKYYRIESVVTKIGY